MSDDNTIRVVEVIETDFGEKAVIDSPFESKEYIKHLPWKEYGEEVGEHGSLKAKAESRGTNTKTSELMEVFDAMAQFDFSDDLSTHVSWNPNALDGSGAWTIDRESVGEVVNFWEFAGFNVEVEDDVNV